MAKMFLFMMISLDGFVEGPDHDLSWHNVDEEFNKFAAKQMQEMGGIVFGRRTYKLMEDYWPTAKPYDEYDQIVRDQMNSLPKIVFSKSLQETHKADNWKNVQLFHENVAEEVQKFKKQNSKNIAVLGSNNLCVTLLEQNLLNELRIMVNPVVIGAGTPLFSGIKKNVELNFLRSQNFQNGNVLLYYSVKE